MPKLLGLNRQKTEPSFKDVSDIKAYVTDALKNTQPNLLSCRTQHNGHAIYMQATEDITWRNTLGNPEQGEWDVTHTVQAGEYFMISPSETEPDIAHGFMPRAVSQDDVSSEHVEQNVDVADLYAEACDAYGVDIELEDDHDDDVVRKTLNKYAEGVFVSDSQKREAFDAIMAERDKTSKQLDESVPPLPSTSDINVEGEASFNEYGEIVRPNVAESKQTRHDEIMAKFGDSRFSDDNTFERFAKMAKDEFGLTVEKSAEQGTESFDDLFGDLFEV